VREPDPEHAALLAEPQPLEGSGMSLSGPFTDSRKWIRRAARFTYLQRSEDLTGSQARKRADRVRHVEPSKAKHRARRPVRVLATPRAVT
jgi:hypothetical protein